jgi:hypothetical protein
MTQELSPQKNGRDTDARARLSTLHIRAPGISLLRPPAPNSTGLEEVHVMEPMVTLVLCLPAALAVIACGCGVAVLWLPAARPDDHPVGGRRPSRRHAI